MINKFNPDGEKDGLWKEFFYNGHLWFKGNYVNGKEDGVFETYNSYGELIGKDLYII